MGEGIYPEQDLARRLLEAAERATPGPWRWDKRPEGGAGSDLSEWSVWGQDDTPVDCEGCRGSGIQSAHPCGECGGRGFIVPSGEVLVTEALDPTPSTSSDHNFEFIALARNTAPDLASFIVGPVRELVSAAREFLHPDCEWFCNNGLHDGHPNACQSALDALVAALTPFIEEEK